jgi:acyl dehydratase
VKSVEDGPRREAVAELQKENDDVEKRYLEDYQVGEKLVSRARTVTEADILNFAGLSGDFHPLHTDAVYAAKSPFGERIAHGMLVLTLGSGLIVPSLPSSLIAFYGMDRIRFTAPVKIGDTIHNESEVSQIREKDSERGVVTCENRVVNQRGETCCVYSTKILCGRAPTDASASADRR